MVRKKPREKSGVHADVLVVGAGPAGTCAAWALARWGAKVILIDRDRRPGSKACAGGLTRDGWGPAGIDGEHPPAFAERFFELSVHTPLGDLPLGGTDKLPMLLTLDRVRWQQWLVERAASSGVDVRLGQRLVRLRGEVAETSRDPIRFGSLVGADGAASRIRRHVGLPRGGVLKAMQVTLAIREAEAAGIDVSLPGVWFDAGLLGTGYGWAFPFENEVRLGISLNHTSLAYRRLQNIFLSWLSGLGLPVPPQSPAAGTIPVDYMGHRFGRFHLAGDAAGLASPLTGEGIAQALVSGVEVAREIVDPCYRSGIIPSLAAQHRRTGELLSVFPMSHFLNAAPWVLRVPWLRRMTLGRYVLGR